MEKINDPLPPRGISRLAFRAPIWLYRLHLGWLLGGRFLLLTHTGRVSGAPRQTVLEVVKHNQPKRTYYIASGYGEKSDWFRNVMKNPSVTILVGNKQYQATAERLIPEEAEEVILEYGQRHPTTLRELARFMGYHIEASETDYRALGSILPLIGLHYNHGGQYWK